MAVVDDETRPVVVADLVAQMPQHGSVRLAELLADELPVCVVGLGQVEGDHAGLVPGGHVAAPRREELERHAPLLVDRATDDGQAQRHQLVEESAFGRLGVGEGSERIDLVVVGAHGREPAARAQRSAVIVGDQPVAPGHELVRASAVPAGDPVGAFHATVGETECDQLSLVGHDSRGATRSAGRSSCRRTEAAGRPRTETASRAEPNRVAAQFGQVPERRRRRRR